MIELEGKWELDSRFELRLEIDLVGLIEIDMESRRGGEVRMLMVRCKVGHLPPLIL